MKRISRDQKLKISQIGWTTTIKVLAILILTSGVLLPVETPGQTTGTWKEIRPSSSENFTLFDFADSAYGCLFSKNGLYTTTTDGGISWSETMKLDSARIVKVGLINERLLIVVDQLNAVAPSNIKLFITTDLGRTWSEVLLPDGVLASRGTTISLLSEAIIGFMSWESLLYKSTDLGASWDTLRTLPYQLCGAFHMFNHTDFVAGGGGGDMNSGFLTRSSDGGVTWTDWMDQQDLAYVSSEFYTESLGNFQLDYEVLDFYRSNTVLYNSKIDSALIFYDQSYIGALYDDGKYIALDPRFDRLVRSGSDSTYYISSGNFGDPAIRQFSTTGKKYAWILSDSGRLFQRVDLLTSVGDEVEYAHRTIPALINAYPNPFNAISQVQIDASRLQGNLTIAIYDLLGRRQALLYEGRSPMDVLTFSWNGTNERSQPVPSGVYFIGLRSNVEYETKPILLLR